MLDVGREEGKRGQRSQVEIVDPASIMEVRCAVQQIDAVSGEHRMGAAQTCDQHPIGIDPDHPGAGTPAATTAQDDRGWNGDAKLAPLEHFHGGGIFDAVGPALVRGRRMLDNIKLYWLPGNAASFARLYWEIHRDFAADPTDLPVACSIFPGEIIRPSRAWGGEPARGGHFAAFEQPDLFVNEIRSAFRSLRKVAERSH